MHIKTLASAVAFAALLIGLAPTLPASAQISYAPEPSTPLTAKDVSMRPPVLGIVNIVGGFLYFEVRNGALVLTQAPEGIVRNGPEGKEPENKVLWTGSSGTEPQKFSLVTTGREEQIRDGVSRTIWSQPIQVQPFQYAAGSMIPFTVTKEVGSMNIADRNHRLLETVPTEALRLTALNNDPAFRKDIRNVWFFHLPVAFTQADPLALGQLYVTYHTETGAWVNEELIRADRAINQFRKLSLHQDMLEVKTHSLDEAGSLENNPDIEYGWSHPL